ncbi:hypothetical protein K435DRAFT_439974 [Dendrothele bispora CBS 962.96]|uniref:Uncharacterized protein n=1 Tax=Dendrothele bispora (strain CBS 962.96) TaxID=1314807 RepID=A0A4S8L2Z2_DENBC|nr:hypothetical protein K435DRAFT_439974 [Dendrothele bispora CBS 962.96]
MILAICMLGTVAAIVLDLLMEQHLAIDIDSKVLIGIIYLIPPLITHLVTTVLIAYKTYCYYVDIKGNLIASDSSRTRVQKILVLLIESGFIYCIFWVNFMKFVFTDHFSY